MKNYILTLLIFATFSCSNNQEIEKEQPEQTEDINTKSTEPVFEVITTEIPGSGWGYQILKDGKMIIDQQQIPAIQGNKRFSTEEDALKTGNLAMKKIKGQNFPPTISIQELDSLKILR
jgi:hypothetical protein